MDICGDQAVFIPEDAPCDECAAFAERLARIEELLEGMQRFTISKTDSEGTTVTATYVGLVETTTASDEGDQGGTDPYYDPDDDLNGNGNDDSGYDPFNDLDW